MTVLRVPLKGCVLAQGGGSGGSIAAYGEDALVGSGLAVTAFLEHPIRSYVIYVTCLNSGSRRMPQELLLGRRFAGGLL